PQAEALFLSKLHCLFADQHDRGAVEGWGGAHGAERGAVDLTTDQRAQPADMRQLRTDHYSVMVNLQGTGRWVQNSQHLGGWRRHQCRRDGPRCCRSPFGGLSGRKERSRCGHLFGFEQTDPRRPAYLEHGTSPEGACRARKKATTLASSARTPSLRCERRAC